MAFFQKSIADINDPLILADFFSETVAGASNTAAAVGNGRLTAGISPWGELVYFRWPTPSYYDHLRYVTKYRRPVLLNVATLRVILKLPAAARQNRLVRGLLRAADMRHGENAPCPDWQTYGRPYEKHAGLGACGGVQYSGQGVLWQDMPVWDSARHYRPDYPFALTTDLTLAMTAGGRSARMSVTQWVHPDADLLVQEYDISAPGAARFYYHAVFAPWMTNPGTYYNPDSAKAGCAALYLKKDGLMLWLYPRDKRHRRQLLRQGPAASDLAELSRLCPDGGVCIAMAMSPPPEQFQAGADRTGMLSLLSFKRPEPSGRRNAASGTLNGCAWQRGGCDAALGIPLAAGTGKAAVFMAAAASPEQAVRIIARAQARGLEALKNRALARWRGEADRIYMPAQAGPAERTIARRSVMNLLTGRDKNSGAITASPSRQPCYCYDWPRDGAFFDLALDLAGLHEYTRAHLLFYKRTQRKNKLAFSPAWLAGLKPPWYRPRGHWYANMNTDGTPGYFKVIPFEIDETGLVLWDIWRHRLYVPDEGADRYRATFAGTVTAAMQAVCRCVDTRTGWMKKVMEDDDYMPKATLQGAAASLTGLAAGLQLAEAWSLPPELSAEWRRAAVALRQGMLERMQSPKMRGQAGWRGMQWCLFPSPLFCGTARDLARPFIEGFAADMRARALQKEGGVGYLGEQLFIFATATAHLRHYDGLKRDILAVLTQDVPFAGSECYGELGLWIEDDGGLRIQSRTSIPHLWNGAAAYLAVLAVREPGLFDNLRPLLA